MGCLTLGPCTSRTTDPQLGGPSWPGCHPWGVMAVPTGAQCHWHCSEQVLPPCVVPVTGEEGKPAINEALSPGFQKGSFWIETAQERCCPLHISVVARYCPAGSGDVLPIYS